MSKPDLSTITLSLTLTKAQGLARSGRLEEAESLLAPMGKLPEDALALETLACVVTQMRDYPRALRLWRILQQRVPGHSQAAALIPQLDQWISRPSWYGYAVAGGAVSLCCLLVALLSWAFSSKTTVHPPSAQPAGLRAPVNTYKTPPPAARPAASTQDSGPTLTFPTTKPAAKNQKRP